MPHIEHPLDLLLRDRRVGIRELERRGIHHHTVGRLRRGQPVRDGSLDRLATVLEMPLVVLRAIVEGGRP